MEGKTHEEGMTLNQYQQRAMTTCTESSRNFSYMMLNLVGEVGEFASKVAKGIRLEKLKIGGDSKTDRNKLDTLLVGISKEINKKHPGYIDDLEFEVLLEDEENKMFDAMKLEAGDILWQLSGLCSTFGWSLEEIAQMNLDKLSSRQQRGKIIGDGDDR